MSNPNPVRVQSGVPNGGQFAPDPRQEGSPFDDAMNDTTPVAMADLGIAVGDSQHLTDFDTGDAMFDRLDLWHAQDGYGVNGMVPIDLYNGIDDGPGAFKYLTDHEPDIDNYLNDRYGADLELGSMKSDEQAAQFVVPLADTDTTADVLTRLRETTKATDLHNDLKSGGLYTDLRETLARQDTERKEAEGSYVTAAMWTAADDGGEPIEDNFEESDIDPASLAEQREQLVDFMRANRKLLAKAAELRPDFYDAAQTGHDFHLTRNGHGTGFWDRGLGEVGNQLAEAAKVHGSAELVAGDDGKLYFQ